jgi:hypothetical protein
MIESLPYSENITVEIDIMNCAGEGAASTVILTKGIIFMQIEQSCYTPKHMWRINTNSMKSSMTHNG